MTTANTNRASLLAGLRTGGVRSSSLEPPHTASPAGTFNLRSHPSFLEEDAQIFNQNISQDRDVDGSINGFSHHQPAHGMNPNSIPFSPGFSPNMAPQAQIQMQMLQLEMMRIQVCCLIFIHIHSEFVILGDAGSPTVSGNHRSSDPSAAFTDTRS
jgi:hypothetical protein